MKYMDWVNSDVLALILALVILGLSLSPQAATLGAEEDPLAGELAQRRDRRSPGLHDDVEDVGIERREYAHPGVLLEQAGQQRAEGQGELGFAPRKSPEVLDAAAAVQRSYFGDQR